MSRYWLHIVYMHSIIWLSYTIYENKHYDKSFQINLTNFSTTALPGLFWYELVDLIELTDMARLHAAFAV